MKELFKKIQEKVTGQQAIDLFASKGLPPIRYYDIYKGQYQSLDLFQVMPLPALLFEWQLNLTEEMVYISLHLVYELVRDTSSISASQDNALKFFDYLNTINELVFNTESANTGKLQTLSFEPVEFEAVGIVHKLNYKCVYNDNSGSIYNRFNWTAGDGDVDIDGVINKSKPVIIHDL